MSILFFDYGYLTVATMIITMLFCLFVKKRMSQFVIMTFIIVALWLIGIFLIPDSDIANVAWGGFAHRSNCEIFLGIGVSLCFVYFLRSLGKKSISLFVILSIPLQLFELSFVISYILCEVTSMLLVIKMLKSDDEQLYALRIIGVVVSWGVIMGICVSINWKYLLPDCRSNRLCLIKCQKSNVGCIKYYEMRNAEDTYDRLLLILNLLDSVETGTIHFLADDIAAYSLLKTTLLTSPYSVDPFLYDEDNTQSFIVKKDSGYFSYVDYIQCGKKGRQGCCVAIDSVLLCNDVTLNMNCFSDCMKNVFSQNISRGTSRYLINTKGDTLLRITKVDMKHYNILYGK